MFENPKWKPIYIKRQWHKRRRRKKQMKQITQKDLINLIKDKQENATNMEERLRISAIKIDDISSAKVCFGEARAYQDMFCYLNSVVIVPERNDELDARQYAVEGINKNRNLVKAYFGAIIKVHTKKRIVGSTTPFESTGKVVVDNGKFVSIKEEDGRYSIIDKADIESIEIVSAPERETLFADPLKVSDKGCVEENDRKTLYEKTPEHEESKALLEPLCNKCGKTKEECPFHRMGSAYEDCSGFEERKPEQEKKVEIIMARYYAGLEERINDFIKDKAIIDIKFSASSNMGIEFFYAMIIYKEDKSEQEVEDEENKH